MNSLQDYENDNLIIGEVISLKQVGKNILLLEGPGDAEFIDEILSKNPNAKISTRPCDGKPNVITFSESLKEKRLKHFAIVDKDFDHMLIPEHIFTYENRDLESMLLQNGGLKKMVENFSTGDKIKRSGSVCKKIETYSFVLANLRNFNYVNKLRFDFHTYLKNGKFPINQKDFTLDSKKLKSQFSTETKYHFSDVEWNEIMNSIPNDGFGYRGKDALHLLSKALKREINTTRADDAILLSSLKLGAPRWVPESWLVRLFSYLELPTQ